ncbi:MAG: hypothetical protein KDA65_05505 [Planctomycetaceae bacterium]|nr:hypothetical protein [Planctomycetaceae bacterium]
MSIKLTKWAMLLSYVSAMVVSIVAHDPFHRHEHDTTQAGHVEIEAEKGHIHHGHHHHHHHSHKHDHQPVKIAQAKPTDSPAHSHEHQHHNGHDDCPICEFLSLKCIETTVVEVESASELIMLASQNALCYHEAFSPYQPPSRAPPIC